MSRPLRTRAWSPPRALFAAILLVPAALSTASAFDESILEAKYPEEASPFSRFRLEAVVRGEVDEVAARAWTLIDDPQFAGPDQEKTVWRNEDGTTVTRVIFARSGFFLGDQDVVTCAERTLSPRGIHTMVWATCEHERFPVDPEIARIPVSRGSWRISPRGAGHSAIVLEGHTAPDVPFPRAASRLVDRFVLEGMRDEIRRLARRVTDSH